MTRRPPRLLTIAGSDSGGGAGIQADLKTFAAHGAYGMSVIAALTAQNTREVRAVLEVPPEMVAAQIDAVLSDIGADAVKIGMLASAPIVEAVAGGLAAHRHGPVVVDPVMIAKGGDPLLRADARQALAERMLPLAMVVTPNLHEAAALAGIPVIDEASMEEAARRIHAMGPRTVLVKGGHLEKSATDILWDGTRLTRFPGERIASTNTHGTGCTLSSAIAAGLAHGRDLEEAIREAKAYVTAAIRAGFPAGRGVGALRHFVERW